MKTPYFTINAAVQAAIRQREDLHVMRDKQGEFHLIRPFGLEHWLQHYTLEATVRLAPHVELHTEFARSQGLPITSTDLPTNQEPEGERASDDGKELQDALQSRDFYKNRCELLQQWQSKMRDPERTIVCDILANCQTLPDPDGKRYGLAADGKAGGEVVALRQENELLRTALRFYANGDHYHLDASEEFDTVSGEPQNWLCSGLEDSETMVEDGEVARHTLMGHVLGWEDAEEDHTPQPIAGEAPFSAAALQTAYNTRPQPAAQVAKPLTEPADDIAPNHLCRKRWIHLPAGEVCNLCGSTGKAQTS